MSVRLAQYNHQHVNKDGDDMVLLLLFTYCYHINSEHTLDAHARKLCSVAYNTAVRLKLSISISVYILPLLLLLTVYEEN